MIDTPVLPLLHGTQMPAVGLGTWPHVGEECRRIVTDAIELGYRLIDTSHKYGNEREVGLAVRESGVAREDFFITSKFNKEHHSFDGVQSAYEQSLERTGLGYLDLFLIHWPVPWLDRYADAWAGLVDLVEQGRVKAIGVSNFKPAHLERIIRETAYVPDVNQIQLSVDLPRLEVRRAHERWGIRTEAWSPLGRGAHLREDPRVMAIADRIGRSPAQVLLRWAVQQGLVPVPRASSRERLDQNLALFDFELIDGDMELLSEFALGEDAARDSDDPANGH